MIWVAFETIKILLETKNIISVTIVVIYIIKDCKINKIIEYMSWSFIVVNLFSALYPKCWFLMFVIVIHAAVFVLFWTKRDKIIELEI